MKHLIVLLLTFAHGGHWLGGHTESVSIAWPAESGGPSVQVHWDCTIGSVVLATGNADMPEAAVPLNVSIAMPDVRARTRIHFSCTARDKKSRREVAGGENDIIVYPDDLPGDFAKQCSGKQLVLLSHSKPLRDLINRAKISAELITALSTLALMQPDVLIIGPDELLFLPLQQPALVSMANRGCQIIVLRQRAVDSIVGYRLAHREALSSSSWNSSYTLLADLDSQTLQAWVGLRQALVVQLSADDASLAVGCRDTGASSNHVSPVDAMLMTNTLGHGRIVVCQLSGDDWADDPRSQILLHNLLDYAATRAEATPSRDRHGSQFKALARLVRNILAPMGG